MNSIPLASLFLSCGLAVSVGFYSCSKYGADDPAEIKLEKQKTKQLELQLRMKNCKE